MKWHINGRSKLSDISPEYHNCTSKELFFNKHWNADAFAEKNESSIRIHNISSGKINNIGLSCHINRGKL